MYTFKSLNEFFLKYMKIDEGNSENICPSCFYIKDGDDPDIFYVDSDNVFFNIVTKDLSCVMNNVMIDYRGLNFDFIDEDGDEAEDVVALADIESISLAHESLFGVKITPFGKAKKCDCGSWMVIRKINLSLQWWCYSCEKCESVHKSIVDNAKEVNNDKLRWLLLNKEEE